MAKFINTRKAASELEELIRNASEKLTLISPYLKISKDFKELLTYRNGKDKITTVIFGKQELNPAEMEFLRGLRFVILKYNEDLHAKCYVNDDKMIITSLNLYEFSIRNNKEMGVLIDKNDPADAQLFEDAYKEVEFISETSQRFELDVSKKQADKPASAKASKQNGFCIMTGVEIPFDVKNPLSAEAHKEWKKAGNEDLPGKFCHFSGEPSNGENSFNKPVLRKNWKKAEKIHDV
jgi:phosphatidylserine/phosphatidylglycerophosphate/cardiolipin synthase-like enzyme